MVSQRSLIATAAAACRMEGPSRPQAHCMSSSLVPPPAWLPCRQWWRSCSTALPPSQVPSLRVASCALHAAAVGCMPASVTAHPALTHHHRHTLTFCSLCWFETLTTEPGALADPRAESLLLAVTNVTGSLLRQQHWASASNVQPTADSATDAQELLATDDAFDLLVTDTVRELLREYGPSSSSAAPDGSAVMPPSADPTPTPPLPSVAQPGSAGRLRATLHLVTHLVYTVASIRYVATALPSFDAGRWWTLGLTPRARGSFAERR